MENNSYESEFMCSSNSYFPPPHAGSTATTGSDYL